ncbi:MAG: holin [Verrucomicrobiota bacterium]|jgi:hypothetical protein
MIEELMNNAVLMALVLAPITTGMIEVVKKTANIQERYLPLVRLLSGVAIAVLIALGTGQDIVQYILVGVVGGLSSAGLYDQKKITE